MALETAVPWEMSACEIAYMGSYLNCLLTAVSIVFWRLTKCIQTSSYPIIKLEEWILREFKCRSWNQLLAVHLHYPFKNFPKMGHYNTKGWINITFQVFPNSGFILNANPKYHNKQYEGSWQWYGKIYFCAVKCNLWWTIIGLILGLRQPMRDVITK